MSVLDTVRSHAHLKARCTLLATVVFAAGYLPLGRFAFMPIHTLPTALDAAIPFQPGWIIIYHSMYPLLLSAAWLSADRAAVTRYTRALLAQMLICFIVFAFFPVNGPRPHELGDFALYRLAAWLDTPLNSFPSLHASMVTTAVAHLWRPLTGAKRGVLLSGVLAWSILVLASTLLTKQHWVVDIACGVILGLACYWWAGPWRAAHNSRNSAASAESKLH
ncbi:MAG: phosphatase PAP2 family protein [Phycisphaerales bacterium]